MPRLSMSVQYSLKDMPPGAGLRGSHVNYCKDHYAPLPTLLANLFNDVVQYYAQFENIDTINAGVARFAEILAGLQFQRANAAQTEENHENSKPAF